MPTPKGRLELMRVKRKGKTMNAMRNWYAILAYRTKAFEKTKEHAVQTHDSLRIGQTA